MDNDENDLEEVMFLSVDNKRILNLFLSFLIISKVCFPIDPVDPNIIIFFII